DATGKCVLVGAVAAVTDERRRLVLLLCECRAAAKGKHEQGNYRCKQPSHDLSPPPLVYHRRVRSALPDIARVASGASLASADEMKVDSPPLANVWSPQALSVHRPRHRGALDRSAKIVYD